MKVIIYSRPGCTFCMKAKSLCESKGLDVDYKVVGSDITKEELEEKVGKPCRTVPQIFITEGGGFFEYIGGYEQLAKRLA